MSLCRNGALVIHGCVVRHEIGMSFVYSPLGSLKDKDNVGARWSQ